MKDIKPYDPYCERFAEDMSVYDMFIAESPQEYEALTRLTMGEISKLRNEYVIKNEGTYNSFTGHFACDACYIAIGMPTAPNGWVAP